MRGIHTRTQPQPPAPAAPLALPGGGPAPHLAPGWTFPPSLLPFLSFLPSFPPSSLPSRGGGTDRRTQCEQQRRQRRAHLRRAARSVPLPRWPLPRATLSATCSEPPPNTPPPPPSFPPPPLPRPLRSAAVEGPEAAAPVSGCPSLSARGGAGGAGPCRLCSRAAPLASALLLFPGGDPRARRA